jgi:hypothetical protein
MENLKKTGVPQEDAIVHVGYEHVGFLGTTTETSCPPVHGEKLEN